MTVKIPAARFTNRFALEARIGFTKARQLRLAIGTLSQIDPFKKETSMEGFLSMNAMRNFAVSASGKESKSIAKDIKELVEDIMENNYVKYPTSIMYKGMKLDGYRVFFDRFTPTEQDGIKGYYFRIHEDMRPDLMGLLGDFVTFRLSKKIKSGAAIRFSMMVTAFHNKMRRHKKVSSLEISLIELRRILALENRYTKFDNFRRRVIEQIVRDINKSELMNVSYECRRTGRKITDIVFHIEDGILATSKKSEIEKVGHKKILNTQDYIPSNKDLSLLTKSLLEAYYYLTDRKCKPGIVYKRILPNMPSSEFEGWEDVYVKHSWQYFENVTKYKQDKRKAGAFIKWWEQGEFKNRLFSEVMEKVRAEKKDKSLEEQENRRVAKRMTASEFKNWYLEQKNKPKTEPVDIKAFTRKQKTVKEKLKSGGLFNLDLWIEENPVIYKSISEEQRKEVEQFLENYKGLEIKNKEEMITTRIEMAIKEYCKTN